MMLEDFHIHTIFCDGKSTPEEIVRAALERGMKKVGFSGHTHTAFDESYCMTPETEKLYREEILALREKYKGKIEIFCGVEQDFYSTTPTDGYDYVIGSVHFLKKGDRYYSIDMSPEQFSAAAEELYCGDFYAMAEDYFSTVAQWSVRRISMVGHLDLIAKFNRGNRFFDEENPRYLTAAKRAIDRLLALKIPFEVNTGAISRGYRDLPYPAPPLLKYILEKGGMVVLSSDSHSADTLLFEFEKWESFLKELGISPARFAVRGFSD